MKNPAGSSVSEEVKLTVVQPVTILGQPEGATKLLGQALTLSVVASGSEPLVYQWHKDGETIDGAEAKALAFEKLETTDAAAYTVSISNEAGTVVSESVAITVHVPITITQQPVEARVIEGETTSFTVAAEGTEPIEYAWRFNSKAIDGASGPVLTIANASKTNEGSYQVVMKNPAGSSVSEEVKLTVVQPVTILGQPEGATKLLGQALTLSVVASGSEPLVYQWHKDGEAIAGAETKALAFEKLETTDAAAYTVSISNEAGTVVSESVAITVHVPITITQQPLEARVIEGETTSFTVAAQGTETIEYAWRFNSDRQRQQNQRGQLSGRDEKPGRQFGQRRGQADGGAADYHHAAAHC